MITESVPLINYPIGEPVTHTHTHTHTHMYFLVFIIALFCLRRVLCVSLFMIICVVSPPSCVEYFNTPLYAAPSRHSGVLTVFRWWQGHVISIDIRRNTHENPSIHLCVL